MAERERQQRAAREGEAPPIPPEGFKRMQCTLGPYRGKLIDMTDEMAAGAITDRWAIDPYADPPAEPPPEMTSEEQWNAIQKAEEAAATLRGEPAPEPVRAPKEETAKPPERHAEPPRHAPPSGRPR
jgi:hypothetical protein